MFSPDLNVLSSFHEVSGPDYRARVVSGPGWGFQRHSEGEAMVCGLVCPLGAWEVGLV